MYPYVVERCMSMVLKNVVGESNIFEEFQMTYIILLVIGPRFMTCY